MCEHMKNIPCCINVLEALSMLKFALDLTLPIIVDLGRYQNNSHIDHWRAAKKAKEIHTHVQTKW